MHPHLPKTNLSSMAFAVLLPVVIAGAYIGIAIATWQTMVSSGAGPDIANTYRASDNPWRYASSIDSFRYPAMTPTPEGVAPDLRHKTFTIAAQVKIPREGADGMIITQGGRHGGWAFYFDNSKPVFHYNLVGIEHYTIAADRPLAPGVHTLVFAFSYDGGGKGGTGTISANGELIARGRIEKTNLTTFSLDQRFDIGEDTGTPVNLAYDLPFKFSGEITRVMVSRCWPSSSGVQSACYD
jgi:hypothetical protein